MPVNQPKEGDFGNRFVAAVILMIQNLRALIEDRNLRISISDTASIKVLNQPRCPSPDQERYR
jgi:hypothetical protein